MSGTNGSNAASTSMLHTISHLNTSTSKDRQLTGGGVGGLTKTSAAAALTSANSTNGGLNNGGGSLKQTKSFNVSSESMPIPHSSSSGGVGAQSQKPPSNSSKVGPPPSSSGVANRMVANEQTQSSGKSAVGAHHQVAHSSSNSDAIGLSSHHSSLSHMRTQATLGLKHHVGSNLLAN